MLSGHTHGGQICLPGGFALTLDAGVPRRYGAGAWVHEAMAGYTSTGTGSSIVRSASIARRKSRSTSCGGARRLS